MAYRDVTEMLRVDTDLAGTDRAARAVALIRAGIPATVSSDRTARSVLVELGLTPERAEFQVRMSHGPMA